MANTAWLLRYYSSLMFVKILDSDQGGAFSIGAKFVSHVAPSVLFTKVEQGEINITNSNR